MQVSPAFFFLATMWKIRDSLAAMAPAGKAHIFSSKDMAQNWQYASPLVRVFFRDGAFYFLVYASLLLTSFALFLQSYSTDHIAS